MRIDALNQVSQLYQTSKPKKVLKNKENDTSDKFEISQSAKDYRHVRSFRKSVFPLLGTPVSIIRPP